MLGILPGTHSPILTSRWPSRDALLTPSVRSGPRTSSQNLPCPIPLMALIAVEMTRLDVQLPNGIHSPHFVSPSPAPERLITNPHSTTGHHCYCPLTERTLRLRGATQLAQRSPFISVTPRGGGGCDAGQAAPAAGAASAGAAGEACARGPWKEAPGQCVPGATGHSCLQPVFLVAERTPGPARAGHR